MASPSLIPRPRQRAYRAKIAHRGLGPRRARGVVERRKKGRRLADPVFNLENRPFYRAFSSRKLPCPHTFSRAELG